MDNAKTVTFDKSVRTRSVTLEGDVFDPAGTLTGGSSSRGASILAKLEELNQVTPKRARHRQLATHLIRVACVAHPPQAKAEVAVLEEKLANLNADLATVRTQAQQHKALSKELVKVQHEARLVAERLSLCPQQQLFEEVAEIEAGIESSQDVYSQSQVRLLCDAALSPARGSHAATGFPPQSAAKEANAQVKKITAAMKRHKKERESKLKALEKECAKVMRRALVRGAHPQARCSGQKGALYCGEAPQESAARRRRV